MRITREMLEEANACVEQLDVFYAEWPDGVEVNETTVRRALEIGLDTDWFVKNVLSKEVLRVYLKLNKNALDEYDRASAAAWKTYATRLCDLLMQASNYAEALGQRNQRVALLAVYHAEIETADKVYHEAGIRAFVHVCDLEDKHAA